MMANDKFPVSVDVLDSSMVRPQYTPQQRSFLVREYYRTNNVQAALLRFREEFPDVRCPSRRTVYKNVTKYGRTGTSFNLNRGRSGRQRTGRSQVNIEAVQNALEDRQNHGQISCRRNGLGLQSATFNRIVRLSPITNDQTSSTTAWGPREACAVLPMANCTK